MSKLTIYERDVSGKPTATYLLTHTTTSSSGSSAKATSRVDVIPSRSSITENARSSTVADSASRLLNQLLTPFLPTGYPHSVSPDYTPYQIYDSCQAFSSTIAGLLASRAVLVGLGVGSDTASATAAMLLSIAQESIGRFATIFFAHYFALRIEVEVKFYRFLADIVNDVAFVLDVLSPTLPIYARGPALCCSSACRAICGVCGGSSKAILSAHFARQGNIGELNAKDGSQETVVSLIGMWVGGWVVTQVHGTKATWICLIALLGVHLWANWMAVRSVRLRTLNRGRAGIVLTRLLDQNYDIQCQKIGAVESLFSKGDVLTPTKPRYSCSFGNMEDLLECLGGTEKQTTRAFSGFPIKLDRLFDMFADEQYLLWLSPSTFKCIVVLKVDATVDTQIKAWCHAIQLARLWKISGKDRRSDVVLETIGQTLRRNQERWTNMSSSILEAGWNVSSSNLEITPSKRILVKLE